MTQNYQIESITCEQGSGFVESTSAPNGEKCTQNHRSRSQQHLVTTYYQHTSMGIHTNDSRQAE
jgi:hypothetical protein